MTCACCATPTSFRLHGIQLCVPCATNLLDNRGRWLTRNPRAQREPWPTAESRCNRRPCVAARKPTLLDPTRKDSA